MEGSEGTVKSEWGIGQGKGEQVQGERQVKKASLMQLRECSNGE